MRKSSKNTNRQDNSFLNNQHTKTVSSKYRDDFSPLNENGIKDIILTTSQKNCIKLISQNTLTFIEGCAGTGKSMAALYYAVSLYLKDPLSKIIVIRTPVEAGSDKIGFLPSDLSEKIAPHFSSAKTILEKLMNPGKVEADLRSSHKNLQFLIPNYALGCTFENSIIIIDEAQMLQPLIMKLLLERIGKNSKIIVLGDESQIYSKDVSRNGLKDAMSKFLKSDYSPKYDQVAYFKFNTEDIIRSDFVKTVITAYNLSN